MTDCNMEILQNSPPNSPYSHVTDPIFELLGSWKRTSFLNLLKKKSWKFLSFDQGCKIFRFSLISDFFMKSNFKGARANLKTTF